VVEATGGQVLTGYSEGIVSRVARGPLPQSLCLSELLIEFEVPEVEETSAVLR